METFQLKFLPIITLLMLFLVSSCNENQHKFVRDLHVETFGNDEQHVFAKTSILFDFQGKTNFSSAEFDVKLPGQDISYGRIRVAPTLEGFNEVTLTADLTSIFKLQGGEADFLMDHHFPLVKLS